MVFKSISNPASPDVLAILMKEDEISGVHLLKRICPTFGSGVESNCLHLRERFRMIWMTT
jgi:hypothetical protein